MRESLIEKKTCDTARKAGWLVHPKAAPGFRSWPDRPFSKVVDGAVRLIFVEFKAPGKKPTRLQKHTHDKLRAQGYEVHVIDSIEAGAALFA
ncbi:MAG: VRR-NUC domain-containing protein [Roseibium sp.]|nr:VRR-NUC domain-containing protein [Roseibium sp.]